MPTALPASQEPSRIIIRLDHIMANLTAVRRQVGDRLVLAAVKADAYGHGAIEVARRIEATRSADWLGVATVGEGEQLRAAGISLPILKLSVARGPEVGSAVAAGLALCVVDEQSIEQAGVAAREQGVNLEVHLKVDTGMRRIGCEPEAAQGLAELVADTEGLRLGGLMSHLPVADTPAGSDYTAAQITVFAQVAEKVEASCGPVIKHLANSGGILAHPDSWFDMVRPGIMVYGSYPDPASPHTVELLAGMEWRACVSFVKPVRAGESVGYGRTWTAASDTWIATVPVGYGDGYSRLLSNRGRMLADGVSYPIVGRVCMDQTMIDLGPEPRVQVGDEVVLIGRSGRQEITVWEIADLMGTIPYEVTCLTAGRTRREFVG